MKDKLALESGLYVTATPIGNLADVSRRTLDVLRGADAILCEDTRVTSKLLASYGIEKPLVPYHDHNAAKVRPKILRRLEAGETLALVSDAGTPLVSDPGCKLVREARQRGIAVIPVPGPSAPIAALMAAGLASDRFSFQGFLPPKQAARRSALEALKGRPETLIFFESAKRTPAALRDMAEIFGAQRTAALARELTKKFEEIATFPLTEAEALLAGRGALKGEVVLLVEGAREEPMGKGDADAALEAALKSLSVKDAATVVAALTGRPRKALYRRALELKGKR